MVPFHFAWTRLGYLGVGLQLRLFSVFLTTSCSTVEEPPTAPKTIQTAVSQIRQEQDATQTYDDELLELGDSIPGFGGIYEATDGHYLVLTDTTTHDRALAIAQRVITKATSDLRGSRGRPLKVKKGTYTFRQLAAWRRAFEDRAPKGLVYVDTDEQRNMVSVGVADRPMVGEVGLVFEGIGVPLDAMYVEILPHPRPSGLIPGATEMTQDSLNGYVRPFIAGVAVSRSGGGFTGTCTVGANAVLAGYGLVTNSHCTEKMLGMDPGTQLWSQPFPFDYVALSEYKDPPVFSGGACPSGRVCRYSDAAMLHYPDPGLWGGAYIAFPVFSPPPFYPFQYTVQIDQRLTNYTTDVILTGRSSGLQSGYLVQTCVRFDPDSATYASHGVTIPGNLSLLCQGKASYPSAGGDSGGPVYSPQPQCPLCAVFLRGIHHAGDGVVSWYSPVGSIKLDLGNVKWDLF